ncbi:Fur family transcriptional regulator [Candidatus Latescibacterota bacterium]
MSNIDQLRMTHQREIILQELKKVNTHPSADEIYLMVRKVIPRISIGTVYRNLELLFKKGFISKIEILGGQKRFDGNPQKHYHVSCIMCNRIDDVGKNVVNRVDLNEHEIADFEIIGYTLHFKGICNKCRSEK